MGRTLVFSVSLLCLLTAGCGPNLPTEVAEVYPTLPETVSFNYDVRPILSDRCFTCHGPDHDQRKADLRLDLPVDPTTAQEVNRRILTDDPLQKMPPTEAHLELNPREIAMLVKWVRQGAPWENHWSFIRPTKPELPEVTKWPALVKQPIDRFIFKKLEREEMIPSSEADRERLLRRVSLDLTGLPPTIEEMDDFLADTSTQAYERVVERLLQSEAHAERLALEWMDVARYADSHGMHADGWRMMWPWRDWVIDAFSRNMPYDEFVSWQLAGDLYPNASREQKLATAFNRNHPMTAEGGAIDEEYRLSYVFDRTETFGTAFMGLTLNCARCHDHKFDPVSQKEYYQLTAFFNNQWELGMTGNDGNFGPLLSLADPTTQTRLDSLAALIRQTEVAFDAAKKERASEIDFIRQLPKDPLQDGLIDHYPFENFDQKEGWYRLDNNRHCSTKARPKLKAGRHGNALFFSGDYDELHLKNNINFEWPEPFSVALWINNEKKKAEKTQTILGTAGPKNNFGRGWELFLDQKGLVNLKITSAFPANYLHIRSRDSVALGQWCHLAFSYDGSGKSDGIDLYVNHQRVFPEVLFDRLYKSIKTTAGREDRPVDRAIRVAKSYRGNTGDDGVFYGMIDEIYLFKRAIGPLEISQLAGAHFSEENRRDYWLRRDPVLLEQEKALQRLRFAWLREMQEVEEIMVMEEMDRPRPAFAYRRGEYDAPMYEVASGVPEMLPAFPEQLPQNRLGLTKWLFDPAHPLTARVTVNRYWQMIFGNGLVRTPHDFGMQGALPSHPALLDWLATSFMDNGWDLKWLLRTMVLSHTYRQSSRLLPDQLDRDPENQLLARASSYRLQGEMIRDNALAASGLLVKKIGGPSVKPYQPEGLWIEKGNFSHKLLRYQVGRGEDLYRRSLYTFIKRTSPPPSMTAFDAPNRTVCTVQRENTSTPLQALVLLNDPQYVEAARVLAERIQREAEGEKAERQINLAFRLATGRRPSPEELSVLLKLYDRQLEDMEEVSAAQVKELLSVGAYALNDALDPLKTAALTMVTNAILNHDDAYMKR